MCKNPFLLTGAFSNRCEAVKRAKPSDLDGRGRFDI